MSLFIVNSLRRRFSRDRKYYTFLKDTFGLIPNNIELYKLALIHRSASFFTDDGTPLNNERLEFLGDAIIEAVVSDYLFIEFSGKSEGYMTKIRSRIVSRESLNRIGLELGLDKYLIVQYSASRIQKHLYGDALEAMVGAVYLDKGFDYANRLFIDILEKHIDMKQIMDVDTDFKSRLIEWCQKYKKKVVFDTVMSEDSTEHNPKFVSTIYVGGTNMGYGEGESKKKADQIASGCVFEYLKMLEARDTCDI